MALPKKTLLTADDDISRLLLSQWHKELNKDFDISKISVHSKDKFWWSCELGHGWYAAMGNRYNSAAGCHVCAGKIILDGFNDLASGFPEVAAEWHPVLNNKMPNEVSRSSGVSYWWKCSVDDSHEWQAKIRNRTKNKPTGCPFCKNQKVVSGVNDLQTLFPEISEEWDYEKNSFLPNESFSKTNQKAWWVGRECGHSWYMRIAERTIRGSGCTVCSGNEVLSGFNDIAHIKDANEMMKEWDYVKNTIDPTSLSRGSSEIAWWKCNIGHSWDMSIKSRIVGGYNCPICSGRRLVAGINDLATVNPKLSKEWDHAKNNLSPSEITGKSSMKVWWICNKNHSWHVSINDRSSYNTKCPVCQNSGISDMERELGEFIKFVLPDSTLIIENDRSIIKPRELDLYIPSLNVAFEFNGIYWHSVEAGKDKNYHHTKWKECADSGVQLIQIWEDDWLYKNNVVKKMIMHKLKVSQTSSIPARKTYVDDNVSYSEASFLLDHNHIQGRAAGTHYIGLRSKDTNDLVAVAVLKKKTPQIADLVRYSTSSNVPGGFTKILKWIKRNLEYIQLDTFSDNEISDGSLYKNSDFVLSAELDPDYKYIYQNKRIHKFLFRKSRFKNDSSLLFEPSLTEKELARLNNLNQVYDSGKLKWSLFF